MPNNPIDRAFLPRLDPEYVTFHNIHLIDRVPPELLPWDPKIRDVPPVPGSSEPLEVGNTKDFDLSKTNVRVFTPKGDRPANGWPVFIWFHGGGWTLGNITSEISFVTQMVNAANCVAVSVNYRLAPENPYPAAVEDAVESLRWVVNQGPKEIGINPKRIAVGGSSSGGNLAAILALKATEMKIPLIFQLLNVPVTDNTASEENLWKENAKAPWLTPIRMMWFRRNYLPNEQDWSKWTASPAFAPVELLRQTPKAWIGICECDILQEEGVRYGEKLRDLGVEVEIAVYKGAPHPVMAMDGAVLAIGRKLVADAGAALARAFAETS
ncbi:hypothetical protein AN958_08345 [Leucoagaricus sp. SymC.cos]|nr:hypothetical protein AN958_08345 [Leucoagaricus sp. SymC.cos]